MAPLLPPGQAEVALRDLDAAAAARLADQHATGLRAGDSLHLAVASRRGARMRTLDRRLAAAAEALGVSVALV